MTKKVAAAAVEESPDGLTAEERGVAPRRWLARVFGTRETAEETEERARDAVDAGENALLAFRPERTPALPTIVRHSPPSGQAPRARRGGRWVSVSVGVIVVLAMVAGGFALMRRGGSANAAAPLSGTLTLETRPAGAEVLVDGQARGSTPLTLTLPPGAHQVTLRRGAEERIVPLALSAGAQVTQHFEFAAPEPAVARLGRMSIVTDPPGARVQIDGRYRGVSPLTVSDLSVSDHNVAVSGETGSAERIVSVESNATSSVVFSLAKVASPVAGWVQLTAPFDVQVREADSVIAVGRSTKIMLTAGNHTIFLSNEALQYRDTRQIQVVGGKTTAIQIDPPKVAISANARPWADVIIDGTNIGQTPISNVLVAIGEHDVIFRHPQLGEKQQTMVVTVGGANRIAVDLRK
jgi:hypothetical protein